MPANDITYRSVLSRREHNWKRFYQRLLDADLYDTEHSSKSLLKIGYTAGIAEEHPIFEWHMVAYKIGLPVGVVVVARNDRHHSMMSVFVKPDYRGKGIGKHLIESAWLRHPGTRGYHTEMSRNLYLRMGIPHFTDSDLLPSMLTALARIRDDKSLNLLHKEPI